MINVNTSYKYNILLDILSRLDFIAIHEVSTAIFIHGN